MEDSLRRIEKWFQLNCDGDWEHGNGVKIETIDNPGWMIEIDLGGTVLQNAKFSESLSKSSDNWYTIKTENSKFTGFGDPTKLGTIIRRFWDGFLATMIDRGVFYWVYFPIEGTSNRFWCPERYRLLISGRLEKVNEGTGVRTAREVKTLDSKNWTFWKEEYLLMPTRSRDIVDVKQCSFFDSVALISEEDAHLTNIST